MFHSLPCQSKDSHHPFLYKESTSAAFIANQPQKLHGVTVTNEKEEYETECKERIEERRGDRKKGEGIRT